MPIVCDDNFPGTSNRDIYPGNFSNQDTDRMCGGENNDELQGGPSTDYLYGENDNDLLHGEGGDDVLIDGKGSDVLVGGGGTDTFYILKGKQCGQLQDDVDAEVIVGYTSRDLDKTNFFTPRFGQGIDEPCQSNSAVDAELAQWQEQLQTKVSEYQNPLEVLGNPQEFSQTLPIQQKQIESFFRRPLFIYDRRSGVLLFDPDGFGPTFVEPVAVFLPQPSAAELNIRFINPAVVGDRDIFNLSVEELEALPKTRLPIIDLEKFPIFPLPDELRLFNPFDFFRPSRPTYQRLNSLEETKIRLNQISHETTDVTSFQSLLTTIDLQSVASVVLTTVVLVGILSIFKNKQ